MQQQQQQQQQQHTDASLKKPMFLKQQEQQQELLLQHRLCSSSLWLLRDGGVSCRHLSSLIKAQETILLQSLSFRLGGPPLPFASLGRHVKLLLQPCSNSSRSCCCSKWPRKGAPFAALLHALERRSRHELLLLFHTPLALELGVPLLAAAAPVAAAISLDLPFAGGPGGDPWGVPQHDPTGGPPEGSDIQGPPLKKPKREDTHAAAATATGNPAAAAEPFAAAAAAATTAAAAVEQLAAFDFHVHHYLAAAASLSSVPAAAAAGETDAAAGGGAAAAAAAQLHPHHVQLVLQLLRECRLWQADLLHSQPLVFLPS